MSQASNNFSIKLKVIKLESEKIVTIKKTARQNRVANFLVGDETGSAHLTVWGVDIDRIPVGKCILVEKSYVSSFNGAFYVNIGTYSKWKAIEEDMRAVISTQPPVKKKARYCKVCELVSKQKQKGINLEKVKVIEIGDIRSVKSRKDGSQLEVADALIGDETGCITLSLWNEDITKVEKDMVLKIQNAYVSEYKQVRQLNLGKYGKYELLPPEKLDVDVENNLSLPEEVSD